MEYSQHPLYSALLWVCSVPQQPWMEYSQQPLYSVTFIDTPRQPWMEYSQHPLYSVTFLDTPWQPWMEYSQHPLYSVTFLFLDTPWQPWVEYSQHPLYSVTFLDTPWKPWMEYSQHPYTLLHSQISQYIIQAVLQVSLWCVVIPSLASWSTSASLLPSLAAFPLPSAAYGCDVIYNLILALQRYRSRVWCGFICRFIPAMVQDIIPSRQDIACLKCATRTLEIICISIILDML